MTPNFSTIVGKVESTIFQPLVGLIIGLAALMFLYALTLYLKPGDAKTKETATATITWGILILAVMLSVWGLVRILTNTFSGWNVSSSQQINIPYMIKN